MHVDFVDKFLWAIEVGVFNALTFRIWLYIYKKQKDPNIGVVVPTTEIAEALNASVRTVKRHLSALRESKLLVAEREKRGRNDIAFVRIEQLYPLPVEQMKSIIRKYARAHIFAWVQEEPANMGAWSFILRNFKEVNMILVARPESGSPATGSPKLHMLRQAKIIDKAFGDCTCENRNNTCKMLCAPKEWQVVEKG